MEIATTSTDTTFITNQGEKNLRERFGISTSKQTLNVIQKAQSPVQGAFEFSHAETKEEFSDTVVDHRYFGGT